MVVVEDVKDDLEVHAAVQRVAALLEEPFEVDSETLFVSASIGVSVARDEADAADLLREADDAMYRAKQRGRRSVEYQTGQEAPDGHEPAGARHRSAPRARAGRARRLLPADRRHPLPPAGRARSARALEPSRSSASCRPADFIPLAEDTGLIVPLGWRVLEHARRRLLQQPRPRDRGQRLRPPALGDRLRPPPDRSSSPTCPRGSLTLEITESLLIDDPDNTAATLAALDEVGIRIALDDFGTGYSSLSNLSTLPIHQLKIDRSFVSGLGDRPESEALVSGIINLGHGLELEVVAEGVETEQQARRLERLDCDFAQGYFFGRPAPWTEAPSTDAVA